MTVTQFAWCAKCDERRELVPTEAGALVCHKCGTPDVYDSEQACRESKEYRG